MGVLNLFKLEKLKVTAYSDKTRKKPVTGGVFHAMFNPASFKQSYTVDWGGKQGKGSSGKELEYSRTPPQELELTLLLDGTGVAQWGNLSLAALRNVPDRARVAQSRVRGAVATSPAEKKEMKFGVVEKQVQKFLDVTWAYQGEIHSPNLLRVSWGYLDFPCRLQSVDITYTMFDRAGRALRAELDVVFVADEAQDLQQAEDKPSSPDLTHRRTIASGDTLPLLCQQIYGSTERYLELARFNDLDDFRHLAPGREIIFPPLERLEALATSGGSGPAEGGR